MKISPGRPQVTARMGAPRGRKYILILTVFLLLPVGTSNAASHEDSEVLGAYLSTKTGLEALNKLVYKSDQLFRLDQHYSYKRSEARAVLLGQYDEGPGRPSLILDRSEYLHRWSEKIDENIRGARLGDTPLADLLSFGATTAAAMVTEGGSLLTKEGGKLASSQVTKQLNNVTVFDPVALPSIDTDIAYHYGLIIEKEIESASPLGMELQAALKDAFGITSISELKNSSEVKTVFGEKAAIVGAIKEKKLPIYLVDKTHTLSDSQSVPREQQLAQIIREQNRQRFIQENRASREQDLASFHTIVAGAEIGAISAGASEQQMRTIRLFESGGEAMIESAHTLASDPSSYANAYYALARFGIAVALESRSSHSNENALADALQSLSERVEEMRKEMQGRFDALTAIQVRTGMLESDQLESLKGLTQLQLEELGSIDRRLQRDQSSLLSAIETYGKHEDDVLWERCTVRDVRKATDDCIVHGYVAATNWAINNAVAKSFSELGSPLAANAFDIGEEAFLKSLPRLVPLYSGFKQDWDGTPVANPQAWNWGTRLYLAPLKKIPAAFNVAKVSDLDDMLEVGANVQRFYQGFFVNNRGDKAVVSLQPVTAMLRNYTEAAQKLVEKFQLRFREVPSEIGGPLPEEKGQPLMPADRGNQTGNNPESIEVAETLKKILPPIQNPLRDPQGPVAKQTLGNDGTPINNFTLSERNVENGRGEFNPVKARKIRLVAETLKLCTNPKMTFTYVGGHGDEGFWRQHIANEDAGELNRGLKVDGSILALIPREALWLEELEPTRYEVTGCISGHTTEYGGGNNAGDDKWTAWIPYNVTQQVQIFLMDNETNRKYPIASLEGRLKTWVTYYGDEYNHWDLYPRLALVWTGSTIFGAQIGPIAGNLDRFYRVTPRSPEQDEALKVLRTSLASIKTEKENEFDEQFQQGSFRELTDQMTLNWRILMTAQVLAGDDLPEVAAAFQKILLNSGYIVPPNKIVDALLAGKAAAMASILDENFAKTQTELSKLEGREIVKPVHTPVDRDIESLKLVRAEVISVNRRERPVPTS